LDFIINLKCSPVNSGVRQLSLIILGLRDKPMKKLSLKLTVGFLALVIGIVIAWASGIFQMLSPAPAKPSSSLPANTTRVALSPTNEESGKIILRFKGFELGKGWMANFEIVNYTAKPITYIGFKSKGIFDFCTLAAQHDSIYEPTGVKVHHSGNTTKVNCRESTAVILQTLEPGESVLFSVFKHEVQDLVDLKDLKSAQIGFEFFVGDEKRREMLWSEEIAFPEDIK
jgi:hypothetical protein